MSRFSEACGCQHDGTRWVRVCDEHALENAAHKAMAMEDYYRTARPDPERTRLDGSDLL